MKIKEVSEITGMSQDTLRYYEKQGLFGEIHRDENGIRDYTEENLERIEFIKYMKTTGISLEALSEFVEPADNESKKEILLEQRKLVEKRIEELQECLRRLDVKLEIYGEKSADSAGKEVIKRCRKMEMEAADGND